MGKQVLGEMLDTEMVEVLNNATNEDVRLVRT